LKAKFNSGAVKCCQTFGSGYRYNICLWILKFEKLFIRHLWRNSNTWGECSKLVRNEWNL